MRGKNIKKVSPKKCKAGILAAAIAVLVMATVGAKGVFAWLKDNTKEITNTFSPSEVSCEVNEEKFENNTKENVSIKNTGNTDAYIRASLVFTWIDAKGNIVAGTPEEGKDYTIDISKTGDWVKGGDGFYYCKTPIAPGAKTPVLINSCMSNIEKEGRYLQLEIVASAIQAKPFNSAEEAWKAIKELPKEEQNNE